MTGLLQRARTVTPDGIQVLARGVAHRLGEATAGVRMQPSFLVAGAQRCGTTTLYRLLADHPSVVRPVFSKGIGYFDVNYARGWAWYRGHFPIASLAALRADRPVTFESSGYYLYHPLAAGRIAADLPGVRLLVLVRDPVERAYSAHRHELLRGFETEPFERALELEPDRLAGEEDRLRSDPAYQSFSHRHHSYLARGRYAGQIERLREAVGPDRVLVVDADRFFEDPYRSFAEIQEWLGLPGWRPAEVGKLNARPRDPMAWALRERLLERFEDADRALVPMLGAEPSWRR
jgi:hypothetical protein